jgi:metalloprotein, YbeY/UPF0054 family
MKTIELEVSSQYSRLAAPDATVAALFEAMEASGRFPISSGELSVVFVDDPTIGQIHDNFMDDPSPTDVITFPANPEMESAGEIIVSVDHAISRAEELGLPFSLELSLYLLHGWLHLAGYDDRNETDRAAMRAAEKEAQALTEAVQLKSPFKLTE